MTNPHKGDVELNVAGTIYTLRYNHGALVKLESKLGKGLFKIMQEMSQPEEMRISTIALLLWAGLQKHHPQVSAEAAIDMLDEIDGGARGTMDILGEAFSRAFNAPGTKGTNPPQSKEGNGTGMPVSSSTSATGLTPILSGT